MATLEDILGLKATRTSKMEGEEEEELEEGERQNCVDIVASDYQKRLDAKQGRGKVKGENRRYNRDPRFGGISGDLDMERYKKSYDFITKIEAKELAALEREVKRTKGEERKKDLKEEINRRKQKLNSDKEKEMEMKIILEALYFKSTFFTSRSFAIYGILP